MKNYKLIENRPELTHEQVVHSMDFTKIKNNAAIAKFAFLKLRVTKGFIGAIIISSAILIYNKTNSSIKEKTQGIFANKTEKAINLSKKNTSVNYTRAAIAVNPAAVVKQKIVCNNTVVVSHLVTDTNAINLPTINNYGSGTYKDIKKTEYSYDIKSFTTPLEQDDMKMINKSFAKINEQLYASKYEVSNKLYMTFLNSLRQSNNANLLPVAGIDTLRWTDKENYNEPYVHYYHSHPAYQYFPVVNISFEGAKLFCEWLTVQYNSDPKRKFKQVLFRLPSEKEWIMAAQGGNDAAIYPWQGKGIRNKRGHIMCNFHRDQRDTLWIDERPIKNQDVTAPVNSYWKNNFGLYNMSGNVAEMISEKGITKGGSWRDNPEYLRINASYKYDGRAQPFVGFRYFVEILEK